MEYTIHPIAHIRTDFTDKFGIPRQSGLVPELTARIVFEPEYRDPNALVGIEGYDRLWLIWQFSTVAAEYAAGKSWRPTVRPPRLGGNERRGVFATRSPYRPNALGLSCVELAGVENGELIVRGADLLDGTPIFDIKPTQSAICAVMLYDAKLSQDFAARLLDEGIYVTGFYYPVVPKDQARIRVQVSAGHTEQELDRCVDAFVKVGRELGVLR